MLPIDVSPIFSLDVSKKGLIMKTQDWVEIESMREEGMRVNTDIWAMVTSDSLARSIAERCNEENPKAEASTGLFFTEEGEDIYLVWVKRVPPFFFFR